MDEIAIDQPSNESSNPVKKQAPTDVASQTVETENEASPETNEKFGSFYSSVLKEALGEGSADTTILEGCDEQTKALGDTITLATREYRHKDHLLASVKQMDAAAFLSQAFPQTEALAAAKLDLQEVSEGIFMVSIDTDSYSKIYNTNSQAVAIKVPEGVSFVMVRQYENPSDTTRKEREENVPHEINHLVWNTLKKEGIVASDEEHPEFQKAFLMFQDELAAKLVSDGGLISYTHVRLMSDEQKAQIEKSDPGLLQQITEKQTGLNDILADIEKRLKHTGESKASLLLSLLKSKNFSGLQTTLEKLRYSLPIPQPPVAQSTGWNTV